MITITRRLAGQLRVGFRKALNITRGSGPALRFATGPDGICVRARLGDAAIEYHSPGSLPPEALWTPFELLGDVEAHRNDPVELETLGDGRVAAGWRDGNVPQMTQYEAMASTDGGDFPAMPVTLAQNPPRLLPALDEAMQTAAPDSTRYALSCIQLRGKTDTLAATDGRQILIQDGFDLPWDETVLVPRTKFYGNKDLPQDVPVAIGKAGDWVAVRVGPWTVFLKIETAKRYPDIDGHVPRAASAAATCRLSAADARFLLQNIPRLPGDDEYNLPVTVDLNGSVVIRAQSPDQPKPTEVVLSGSTATGEPMRIHTNRKYLTRSVELGFEEVCLYSPKTPVMCRDEHRRYVWALLRPESAIKPADNATRITSPAAEPNASIAGRQTREPRKRKAPMPQSPSNGTPRTATTAKPDDQGVATLIEQAEAVKASLRENLSKTGELILALKRHRKESKAVQTALVSLRRLQTVDA